MYNEYGDYYDEEYYEPSKIEQAYQEFLDKAKELIKEYEKPVGQETNLQIINYFNIEKDDILEVVGNIFEIKI